MLQMDLQKAYDTVEWGSLEVIMCELGIPEQFVRWTMCCVTTVSYKYSINAIPSKILKARSGLR